MRCPTPSRCRNACGGCWATLYLVFNEGYLASSAEGLVRADLCAEAIRLTRLTVSMLPGEEEARGLLALMILNDARRAGRIDERGAAVPLEAQDRSLWDPERIAEGLLLSEQAAAGGPTGPYVVQARIAAAHARRATTRGHRLGAHRAPLRLVGSDRPGPGRGTQPGGGGGDERRDPSAASS